MAQKQKRPCRWVLFLVGAIFCLAVGSYYIYVAATNSEDRTGQIVYAILGPVFICIGFGLSYVFYKGPDLYPYSSLQTSNNEPSTDEREDTIFSEIRY